MSVGNYVIVTFIINLNFWLHISICMHFCRHTPCHNCKWWWIFAVRLTRGRRWRRGVSRDGEQTEDQAHGSRLAVKNCGFDWRQCCLSKVNPRTYKPFCVYSTCNVHTFVALLQTPSLFIRGLGTAVGIIFTVPKVNQNWHSFIGVY